ncbi:NDP-sugar synthase [Desulfosediminicola flagellatus]|uniref:NDP-sugar synthase n=1 Tax=Desulfosediminicola flagellatus TaxID=2569541 RepID=UPI0010AD05AE|nr:NDP-sugar synthase [Desulfosediminicola flagellatus]
MKALICIREKYYSWVQDAFPGKHPALLRICNKPLIEYMLDFVILNGCTSARLIFDEPSPEIESYLGTGSRWGIELSFSNSRDSDSIDSILLKNDKFIQNTPLLMLEGFFFIHYDKKLDYRNWQETSDSGKMISCTTGAIRFGRDSKEIQSMSPSALDAELSLSSLESVKDIYQICMEVLAQEQDNYVLPGYSADKGTILGRNVEIGKDVVINPPVIIGDNVRLLGEAVIGPSAVIDKNVIIDSATEVKESAVLEGSYLGRNLYVDKKIVSGRTIFSGTDAESIDIEDAFLFSEISPVIPWQRIRQLISSIGAVILLLILGIPYLILGILRKLQGDWKKQQIRCYINHTGDTVEVNTIASNKETLTGRLFSTFYLEKIPLLMLAIQGKMRLIGNLLLPATSENHQSLQSFPEYAPGVFSYTEADNIAPGTIESEVAERFYAAHRSVVQDTKMLAKALLTGPDNKTMHQ